MSAECTVAIEDHERIGYCRGPCGPQVDRHRVCKLHAADAVRPRPLPDEKMSKAGDDNAKLWPAW